LSVRNITCDIKNGLIRIAVWKNKDLYDLYIDKVDCSDMTGAIVRGKIIRINKGQEKAWIDAGINEKLYIEKVTGFKTGDNIVVRIQTTKEQGKAWPCKIVGTYDVKGEVGIVKPPPLMWQKALNDLPKLVKASFEFSDKKDLEIFEKMNLKNHKAIYKKQSVNERLDDYIDALLNPVVKLKQTGHLVIQQTEALVAIDINGGSSKNSTDLNMRAIHEVIRQIRLRNLSGIIIIDCLNMSSRTDKAKIKDVFNKASIGDRCKMKALGITKLGLLEVTRSRQGSSIDFYYD